MPQAEFSEDEFEDNLIQELRNRWGRSAPHFKPSRLLENVLGYDFALFTEYSRLRAPGLSLHDPRLDGLNAIQRKALLPNRFVSTFIQVKRPFLAKRNSSSSSDHWDHWSGRHFRVALDKMQIERLALIEDQVGDSAVARVASPCFWQFNEADAYLARGEIVERTHFQRPRRLKGHVTYSYIDPLRPGFASSDPESIDPATLISAINSQERRIVNVVDHILGVVLSLRRTDEYLRNSLRFTDEDNTRARLALGNLASLPLFPIGRLGQGEFNDVEDQYLRFPIEWTLREIEEGDLYQPATLELFAKLIFALDRVAKADFRAQWLIFYENVEWRQW